MAGLTVQQAFEQALQHQQAGRMPEAEALYRQIIAQRPNLAEVHNNLGNALKAMGRLDEAEHAYREALSIRSDIAQIHNNLGSVLHENGQLTEALTAYQKALSLRADYPEAKFNLGNTFLKMGHVQQAIESYRQAIALWPNYAEAHCNLGNALALLSRRDEAIVALRQAVWLRPNYPDAWNNLANQLLAAHKYAEAISAYKQAIAQRPDFADTYNNLGNAFRESGRFDEAIEAHQQAIARRRDFAEAFYNLAIALSERERLDEAIEVFRHALQLRPAFTDAWHNLASVVKDTGDLDEALACYRKALSLQPSARVASDLLYTLCFTEQDPRVTREHARQWNDQFAKPLRPAELHFENELVADRRLRIGYVSPDFREHPVGRFILPLLAHHDQSQFEVFCYTDVRQTDWLTDQLKAHADIWRSTIDLPDERLAQLIREDKIDILVDLTMHMRGSRLLAFARKPAPVQVTYLAYAGTTGLEVMDYRLSDPYLDPLPNADCRLPNEEKGNAGVVPFSREPFYSEKTARLRIYWCYQPSERAPQLVEPPAIANRHITFGCLNNFSKVNVGVLNAWARILAQVPGSKLLLYAPQGNSRQRVEAFLSQQNLDPRRLQFVNLTLPIERYLEHYQQVDIALDPFPYPGGTTSCDALWMGVPVISLAGRTAISRSGLSILSNIGLAELVATDVEQYIKSTVQLAGDLPRLTELRKTMRPRMQSSPLMDADQFTRDVEAAFRQMWRTWCEGVTK